jgi:hypothetical protein
MSNLKYVNGNATPNATPPHDSPHLKANPNSSQAFPAMRLDRTGITIIQGSIFSK